MTQDATPLVALDIGSSMLGLRLFGKCEQYNVTGTQKDRVAHPLVARAIANRYSGVTVGSCGNLGVALAHACYTRNLRCTVFVPRFYSQNRSGEITSLGATVVA